jgi:hypothetical protein
MIWETIALLIVFLALSSVLGGLWQRIFTGKKYRVFLAPGIIIHELSHAFACLITGARVRKISLFVPSGGYVIHEKPKLPVLGEILISFAPAFGGLAAIFLLSFLFQFSLPMNAAGFLKWFVSNWLNWRFWLFAYLNVSIIICLVPSFQDLKNASLALLLTLVLIWLLKGSVVLEDFFRSYLLAPLSVGVAFETFFLTVSFPFYLLKLLFRR